MGHQPARRRALVVVAPRAKCPPRDRGGRTNRCSRASSLICGAALGLNHRIWSLRVLNRLRRIIWISRQEPTVNAKLMRSPMPRESSAGGRTAEIAVSERVTEAANWSLPPPFAYRHNERLAVAWCGLRRGSAKHLLRRTDAFG